jgi:hypothetical protein
VRQRAFDFAEADGTFLGKAHFFDPTQSGDGFL